MTPGTSSSRYEVLGPHRRRHHRLDVVRACDNGGQVEHLGRRLGVVDRHRVAGVRLHVGHHVVGGGDARRHPARCADRLAGTGRHRADRAHILATSGMTLVVVPALIDPTVTTAGSKTSTRRVTNDCSAPTISQATGIGSAAKCGIEAWPAPAPHRDRELVGRRHDRPSAWW